MMLFRLGLRYKIPPAAPVPPQEPHPSWVRRRISVGVRPLFAERRSTHTGTGAAGPAWWFSKSSIQSPRSRCAVRR